MSDEKPQDFHWIGDAPLASFMVEADGTQVLFRENPPGSFLSIGQPGAPLISIEGHEIVVFEIISKTKTGTIVHLQPKIDNLRGAIQWEARRLFDQYEAEQIRARWIDGEIHLAKPQYIFLMSHSKSPEIQAGTID